MLRASLAPQGLIGLNFIMNVVQKQVDPREELYSNDGQVFDIMETVFNIIFLVELLVSKRHLVHSTCTLRTCMPPCQRLSTALTVRSTDMYGHWFHDFWHSGWNQFDVVVVAVGMVDVAQYTLPPPMTMLRMLRAFRVFRLFKR